MRDEARPCRSCDPMCHGCGASCLRRRWVAEGRHGGGTTMQDRETGEIWVEVDGIAVGLVDDARAVIVKGPHGRHVHDHSLCGFLAGHVILDRARFFSWVNQHMPLVHRAVERGRLADSTEVDDWDFPDDPYAFSRPWFGMINEPSMQIDLEAVKRDIIGRRSRPKGPEVPELTVVMGPVASGKTTLRRSRLASHVPIDPAELYLLLTLGDTKVPANIGRLLQDAGRAVALAALCERRHVALEVLPSRLAHPLVMDAMPRVKALGYRTSVLYCDVPFDVTLERNRGRADREISAVHTEIDAIGWVRYALREIEEDIAARQSNARGAESGIQGVTSGKHDLPPIDLLDAPPEEATAQAPTYDEAILRARDEAGEQQVEDGVPDDLYRQAAALVTTTGRASTAWLQRKLGIGYNRAAKLMGRMEREGIVPPPERGRQ
ncbi:MAG: hypothetical protein HYY06_12735 [Deltaproteobacteria bacterium]|nr:hypothetical protein [Deltaproteobacteria bacterium]